MAGTTIHATVGSFETQVKTFTATLQDDCFDIGKTEKMEAGNTLPTGGDLCKDAFQIA